MKSASKDTLGDRMKQYEYATRNHLTRRTPAIIRIDGKSFHSFTKNFQRPFDPVLVQSMQNTMKYLCENVQGCVLGYTQSDEITLVLVDYTNLETSAWFDYNVQKCASVAASMATAAFNREFRSAFHKWNLDYLAENLDDDGYLVDGNEYARLRGVYEKRIDGAMFDARVFSLPKEEVCNCLIWRQQDAIRNSVNMLAREYFSDKELFKKTSIDVRNMLASKGVNWCDIDTHLQRGSACVRVQKLGASRPKWTVDINIPLFTEDRGYVDNLVIF